MHVEFQPVEVAVDEEGEGRLTFVDGRLAAVLVRLSGTHGDQAGRWFLEVGFGRLDGPRHPVFPDLDAAGDWIKARLSA